MEVTIQVKKIAGAVSKTGDSYQEIIDEQERTHRNFDKSKDDWVK